MKSKIFGGIIIIFVSIFIFFVGIEKRVVGDPIEVYQVYLDGKKIGLIQSKNELYDLIDKDQTSIKDEYNVDKVYPPTGLDIEKIYTYDNNLTEVNEIYNSIKNEEPFTIKGYKVTITYTDKKVQNDMDVQEEVAPPVYIYTLDKDLIKEALYNIAKAFIPEQDLKAFENNTQEEITETGSIITSVNFQEVITIKEDLISTNDYIFKNVEDLSRYLLFGTLEDQNTHVVKTGENFDNIAANNQLNVQELLIANPKYKSSNVLLVEGEKLNVGLINPLVNVIYRKTVVEDQEVAFKTEYVDDNSKYVGSNEVKQEGANGIRRVTQDVIYVNSEVNSLKITYSETKKEALNKIIVRGTKTWDGGLYYYENTAGNDQWSWPTISPFVITSRYKWRWGRQHQGVDISGTGLGSPIFAVGDGVVYKVNTDASKAEGISVTLYHGNINGVDYYTQYMHCIKILVSVGQQVKREQKIALMGSTGSSTGTHLHLGVVVGGPPYVGGTFLDPCNSIFSC